MPENASFQKLKIRALSAFVLAPVVLFVIYLGGLPFLIFMVGAWLVAAHEWVLMSLKLQKKWLHSIFGLTYLLLCFLAFAVLRLSFEEGLYFTLSLLISVWAGDIGAYLVGKKIGGPKMAPLLSPKKTWAGLAGAMFFTAFFLTLFWSITRLSDNVSDWLYVVLFGLGLGVVQQAGDLLVSYYKRSANIKDTGSLIPGHGGLLDRIDALLLASPVFLIFIVMAL